MTLTSPSPCPPTSVRFSTGRTAVNTYYKKDGLGRPDLSTKFCGGLASCGNPTGREESQILGIIQG